MPITKLTINLHLSRQCTSVRNRNNQQDEEATYETGKIFANHKSDEGLISKLYEELIQLVRKNKTDLKNGQRTQIDMFPKKTHK